MKIGYNKIWGVMFFMLDGMICCLAVVFARTEQETFPPALVAGFWLCILLGILFLTRTYIGINQSNVFIQPLIGFGMKTYQVHSAKDFSVEGKDVFITSAGGRQRLPVAAWLVDPSGWASFIKWVETTNQQTSRTLDEVQVSSSS